MPRFSVFLLPIAAGLLLLGSTQCSAQFSPAANVPDELAEGFHSITADQAETWLSVLAGPDFEGRGTGQAGYVKAAHWVAGKVAEMGLEPVGDNGTYFQMLPMKRRVPVINECSIKGPKDLEINGEGNLGFERYTETGEVTGEVVFLSFKGANVALPEELVLRDKIVMYAADDAAIGRAPRILAMKRPAAAIRVIDGTPQSTSQLIRGAGASRNTSVSGTIKRSAAEQVATATGGNADWLQAGNDDGVAVHETGEQVSITLRVREEAAAVPNVVAWLEGSDPTVNHEYVVIGSHLDHLGVRSGMVYPGADDNGSGSTAVLSIAKAMTQNGTRPRRSVLFMWFAAEEIGLVGSRHYCDNPLLPLDNMICMFNIDMVGRNEETKDETSEENEGAIHLVGSKKGESDIHALVEDANKYVGFRFEYDEEDVFGRSDQINFYRKGVPVAFLFGGFHPDYHQSTDKVAKINFKKIASAAKLYYIAINLASEHGRFEMKPE